MNRLIDLTHTFTDNMPVYPGDPCARLYQTCKISNEGFTDHKIESGMHVGTHMDAPLHMIEGGLRIDEISVEHFQARGVLIDARNISIIDENLLQNKDIRKGDIVLAWTGWDNKYHSNSYFENWPVMTAGFANALVEKNISLIGMDTAGPEMDSAFPVHKILLSNNIYIIENLTNLEKLKDVQNFTVHAYPMKYKADAAPVRVIVEVS